MANGTMTQQKTYGLLGYPLGHSFSRAFFNDMFAREGIDAEYLNFELPTIELLPQMLKKHPLLCGFNVTIPYKQAVIPLLDELSDEAREIGAVNVVRVEHRKPVEEPAPQCQRTEEEGTRLFLKGFNSDIIGFTESLRPLLQPHHKKALVLGTGGASKAVCVGLQKLGVEWRSVSRKKDKIYKGHPTSVAAEGAEGDLLPLSPLTYADLSPTLLTEYTLIVNCTPLGMYPKINACPDIPYNALTPKHLLYDLVYNPEETLFLKKGREHDAIVKSGLEMLHLQAKASWRFWNEGI